MVGFFHEVKIIHTTRGPKKEGTKKKKSSFLLWENNHLWMGPGLLAMG